MTMETKKNIFKEHLENRGPVRSGGKLPAAAQQYCFCSAKDQANIASASFSRGEISALRKNATPATAGV
jgi:hypothetical protein